MFTVIVGREASGNNSTRAPLARRYSVTPSTVAIFFGASSAHPNEAQNSKIDNEYAKRMETSDWRMRTRRRAAPEQQGEVCREADRSKSRRVVQSVVKRS